MSRHSEADKILQKLELISQFKALIYSQKNKNQTLQEIFLKANQALMNQLTQNLAKDQETQTDFEFISSESQKQILISNSVSVDKNTNGEEYKNSDIINSYYSANKEITDKLQIDTTKIQYQPNEENIYQRPVPENNENDPAVNDMSPENINISPEVKSHQIQNEKSFCELNSSQNISTRRFVPTIPIDVLILIGNQKVAEYVKKSFEQPGVQFFDRIENIKFENPTIIVRISATRNLDDKLESAIKLKQPKKSVTMVLLGQASVPISDKQINVPQSRIKINIFTFLYDDQFHEPPFRTEGVCETKGIYKISDVLDLLRRET